MSLTLIEAYKQALGAGDVVRASIIEIYARSSPILAMLPFDNITGNALKYNQESVLPGIAFRGVNEGYTESTGVVNPVVEPLVITGGDLDVDKFIVDTQGQTLRARHEAMKVKSLAHNWTHKFIKGDAQSDPREFDGIQVRIDPNGSQLVDAGGTDGGDALSLAKLDELIDAVDEPTHLMMNKTMRRRLTAAARNTSVGGYITYTQDAFGRTVTRYNDLPIVVIGDNDQVYDTLAFNEVGSGGSTATACSIYCASMRPGMLSGIQNGGIETRDIGELESKPVFRTRVEWYTGLTIYHPRAIARLRGVADAAVVV